MEIIVTHINADFDALASQVAAQKLYPDAKIVLGRRVSRPVRDFLALHKDRFKVCRYTEIDQDKVDRLILVDVRRADRLKEFEALLKRTKDPDSGVEVVIYDHHPASLNDLVGDIEIIEPVGSATTLLIEAIRHRNLTLDSVEATLLAIGIHTDTGSLTYASTTARDAEALAWLLRQDVSLKMVNRYLSVTFTAVQRELLSSILAATQVYDVGGVEIGFAIVPLNKMIDDSSSITTHALELTGHQAIFTLFPIKKGKRLLVIGRARVPYVDIRQILEELGGGGHAAAGSATIKGGEPKEVLARLLAALRVDPPRPRVVSDVMSSPVYTVEPQMLLSELRDSLESLRYTGVPVLKKGKLSGIISRRDVQTAERNDRLHLSVSSCMSHIVHTVGPLESIDHALKLMVDRDIGRLPVVEDDHVLGIITRSDLIRILY